MTYAAASSGACVAFNAYRAANDSRMRTARVVWSVSTAAASTRCSHAKRSCVSPSNSAAMKWPTSGYVRIVFWQCNTKVAHTVAVLVRAVVADPMCVIIVCYANEATTNSGRAPEQTTSCNHHDSHNTNSFDIEQPQRADGKIEFSASSELSYKLEERDTKSTPSYFLNFFEFFFEFFP